MIPLKVGDRVLVLDPYENDPDPHNYPGVTDRMPYYAGGIYMISEELTSSCYRVHGTPFVWASRWLLPLNPMSEDLEKALELISQTLEKNPKLLKTFEECISDQKENP